MDRNDDTRYRPLSGVKKAASPKPRTPAEDDEVLRPVEVSHFDDYDEDAEQLTLESAVVFDEALARRKARRERAENEPAPRRTQQRPRSAPLPEPDQLSFDTPAVLDEAFAARKAAREEASAQEPQPPVLPAREETETAPAPQRLRRETPAPAETERQAEPEPTQPERPEPTPESMPEPMPEDVPEADPQLEDIPELRSAAERAAQQPAPAPVPFTVTVPDDIYEGAPPEDILPEEQEEAPVPARSRSRGGNGRRYAREARASARREADEEAPRSRVEPTEERGQRVPTYRPRRTRRQMIGETLLYSGETVSTATYRIGRQFAAFALCLLLTCAFFWGRNAVTDFLISNDYDAIYTDEDYEKPVSVPFSPGPQALPSGYAAAQSVSEMLGGQVPEKTMKKGPEDRVFPGEVEACLTGALPDVPVKLRSGLRNSELLTSIYRSLSEGSPVIVLLGEVSGFHYGIVTDMDPGNDSLTVTDPESGIAARYATEDFLEATHLESYQQMPIPEKIGVALQAWPKNTAIFLNEEDEEES